MSPDSFDFKIDLTKVPLAFAEGLTLKKAARWNNEPILTAGTLITQELIAEFADIALYIPTSLRIERTVADLEAKIQENIRNYQARQAEEKVKDISQSYEEGQIVFEQGDAEDQDCYFLVEGSVRVVIGGKDIALIDEPGLPIGEMSYLSGDPRTATIVAAEPAKLLRVKKSEQKTLLRSNPTIVKTLLDALVKRLKDTSQRLRDANEKLEQAESRAGKAEAELKKMTASATALAGHAKKELGLRRGDLSLFAQVERQVAKLVKSGEGDKALELLKEYREYLEARGVSKVAAPIVETENLPPRLRELTGGE
jgi:CRP-like cAMP-binding protein